MCGRTSLFHPQPEVEERFDAQFAFDYEPRYNVAPGSDMAAVPITAPDTLDAFRWGLVPHWADTPDDGPRPINARIETLAEKPAFRDPFRERRCLVPSSGYYEWQGDRGRSRPYRIHPADDEPFAFAGVWDRWESNGESIRSIAIVTCEARPPVDDVHDRMPVILDRGAEADWLAADLEVAREALEPTTDGLELYAVNEAVNDPANDSAVVIEPDRQEGLEAFE
jgi:putative SOS response-associated peptidase YedK